MPGFDNSVLYADNVDFSGATPVTGKVTTDGQLLIGSTATPNIRVGTLTAGAGISITNGSGSITITNTGSAFPWSIKTTDTSMAVNNGYITNTAGSALNMTLPASSAIGDVIEIMNKSAVAGFVIKQNSGQSIHFGGSTTTVGTGGSLASISQYDTILLKCLVANTEWSVTTGSSNFTVV